MSQADITLSEDRLRAILAEFKLDLIERLSRDLAHKADVAHVRMLEKRIEMVEQHGSRDAQEALKYTRELRNDMEAINGWRNRILGMLAVLTAGVLPLILVVLPHYLP